MPHMHHHDTDVLEPEVGYAPARQVRRRRPSMTVGIISGVVRYVQAGVIMALLAVALVVVLLWAAFAYGGNALPAFGDWFHDQVTPTTTTTAP